MTSNEVSGSDESDDPAVGVGTPNIGIALLRIAQDLGGFNDLKIPEREHQMRSVDFG